MGVLIFKLMIRSAFWSFFLIQNENKLIREVLFFNRAFNSQQMPVNFMF
ncbi:hypothetical protein AEQU3_01715 [Aequorivita antarctica]|nr:hypothetical protein AEQU3_01715 [Aequorivita antarctica]